MNINTHKPRYTNEQLDKFIGSREARLYGGLYTIVDKDSNKVPFKPNWAQDELYKTMHHRENILKARQLGLSTGIDIYLLDIAMFDPNMNCGILADTLPHAKDLFRTKVKNVYEALPEEIQEHVKADASSTDRLAFGNGSTLAVDATFVGGTVHILHVSELGPLSVSSPEKAAEVVNSTFPTVPKNIGQIFSESTARGKGNIHHKQWRQAEYSFLKILEGEQSQTPLDFYPRFFPAYSHPEYRIADPLLKLPNELVEYFLELESNLNISLDEDFKSWYYRIWLSLGDKMRREFPNTPEEAFQVFLKGAIFAKQITEIEKKGYISEVPSLPNYPVDVYFDIGYNDRMSLWFIQPTPSGFYHVNYFFEDNQQLTPYYAEKIDEICRENNWILGTIYLPHDGDSKDAKSVAGSVYEILDDLNYTVEVVKKEQQKYDSITKARMLMLQCKFNEKTCEDGIIALRNYKWKKRAGTADEEENYDLQPAKSVFNHAADAFQTFSSVAYVGDIVYDPELERQHKRVKDSVGSDLRYFRGRNTFPGEIVTQEYVDPNDMNHGFGPIA